MDLGRTAFYICIILSASRAQYDKITMGPFDLIMRHLEECPEIGLGKIRFTFKLRRVGRDQFLIDANASNSVRIDDTYSILFEAAKFGNGGWNEKYFVKEFSQFCSIGNLAPQLSKNIAIAAGYPNGDKCPIKPKTYSVRNLKLELDISHLIPMFMYGKYRGDLSVIRKGKVYGCYRTFIDVVPKRVAGKKKRNRKRA